MRQPQAVKSLGWSWLPVLCAMAAVAGWAADIIPRVDRRQPSFKILSIKEHRVNIEQEGDNQLHKVYLLNIQADGGTWSMWVNRDDNRVIMQRFSGQRQQ